MNRLLVCIIFGVVLNSITVAGEVDGYTPDPETVLNLIRNDKLDLILPSAMRENDIDMWINVARDGQPSSLEYEFGNFDGYLIFSDDGDRVERAMFGGIFTGPGGINHIDVFGSTEIARAIAGYEYDASDIAVYDEIREYIAERDPQAIAVNFSDWLAVADGISHTQFVKLEKILGPKYAERIVSAEHLITDYRSRRTLREIVVQTNTLEIARQNAIRNVSRIVPGVTTIGDCACDARIYYSVKSERIREPHATSWIRHPDYVFQRGDFFAFSGDANWMDFGDNSFGVDTKQHGYILREGEHEVPEPLQYAWDQTKKAQGIIRQQVKVGMTSGEALEAIIQSLERADYIYTPFTDDPADDYRMIQELVAGTGKSGFYFDLHAMGNNGGSLVTVGPSMAPFRRDRDDIVIRENHIFAFEFAVHTPLPDRPGYPITINFSNPQAVTSLGVEWIQPANDAIFLVN
jgi:Xaa-Pro dipeptidase